MKGLLDTHTPPPEVETHWLRSTALRGYPYKTANICTPDEADTIPGTPRQVFTSVRKEKISHMPDLCLETMYVMGGCLKPSKNLYAARERDRYVRKTVPYWLLKVTCREGRLCTYSFAAAHFYTMVHSGTNP